MNILSLSALATVTAPVTPRPTVCTATLNEPDRTVLCTRTDPHGADAHYDALLRLTFAQAGALQF